MKSIAHRNTKKQEGSGKFCKYGPTEVQHLHCVSLQSPYNRGIVTTFFQAEEFYSLFFFFFFAPVHLFCIPAFALDCKRAEQHAKHSEDSYLLVYCILCTHRNIREGADNLQNNPPDLSQRPPVPPPNFSHPHCLQSYSHIHLVFTCSAHVRAVSRLSGSGVNQTSGQQSRAGACVCGSCRRQSGLVSRCGLAVTQQPTGSIRAADRFHTDWPASTHACVH